MALLEQYDSVETFLARAAAQDDQTKRYGYYWDGQTLNHAYWYGYNDPADYPPGMDGNTPVPTAQMHFARHGDPRGLARLEANLESLGSLPPPESVRRRRTRADFGDEVDMTRVYRGQIDTAWSVCRKRSTRAPRNMTVVVSAATSGCHDSDALFWRGAAAVRLSDLLSDAGYNVEILMFVGGSREYRRRAGRERVSCYITAKALLHPMDKALLSGSVCHPGFFRSLCHRWGTIVTKREGGGGWWGPFDPQGDEVIDGSVLAGDGIRSLQDAKDFIEQSIRSLTGEQYRQAA